MTTQDLEAISNRLAQMMSESSRRSSDLHFQFLNQRQQALQQVKALIEMKMKNVWGELAGVISQAAHSAVVFTSRQLDEFGSGKMSSCFGTDFAVYDQKRIPRIPNGELKMMSRVVKIDGTRRDFSQPASIVVEYDVPPDAWYLRDSQSTEPPYSILMEIALQPCGFLSAYLDTYSLVPDSEFYFRNLDGSARVVETLDVRGATLTTYARMLTSVASSGTVIQKFAFSVECAGRVIFQGESAFGYFSTDTMINQVGLDGGRRVSTWLAAHPEEKGQIVDTRAFRGTALSPTAVPALPAGRLGFLEQVFLAVRGGKYGNGYVHACRPVNPNDWFYPYHFYGDPVMPGSLGVEAVIEALKLFAFSHDLGKGILSPRFSLPAGAGDTSWRYRGQITQQNETMELEAHVSRIDKHGSGLLLLADAGVWVDGLRIYEVKDLSLRIVAG